MEKRKSSKNLSSFSDNAYELTGISTNSVDGSSETAIETEERNFIEEVEWNKWVDQLREEYIEFLILIKNKEFGRLFFNKPFAEAKAFSELIYN